MARGTAGGGFVAEAIAVGDGAAVGTAVAVGAAVTMRTEELSAAVGLGVGETTGIGTVGEAEANATGGGALAVALAVASGAVDGLGDATGTIAGIVAEALASAVALGVGFESLGEGDDVREAVGVVVAAASALGSGSGGKASLRPNVAHSPKAMISNDSSPPPIRIQRRACASCGATICPGASSGASSSAGDAGTALASGSVDGVAAGVFAGGAAGVFAGGFQPGGALISTIPLHFGQARIWPIADSCRTFNRERHVMQVTEKSSTAGGRP